MSKFKEWSSIIHRAIAITHPSVKLGQAQEILAAAFGHRTFASFREHDLSVLEGPAQYVLIDHHAAMLRAQSLGFILPRYLWLNALGYLKPTGVSRGMWLINEEEMNLAANVTFEDCSSPHLDQLASAIGTKDGQKAGDNQCIFEEGTLPDPFEFHVNGEVGASDANHHYSIPVIAIVSFPRVGRRCYGKGQILSAKQIGRPQPRTPIIEFEFQWSKER